MLPRKHRNEGTRSIARVANMAVVRTNQNDQQGFDDLAVQNPVKFAQLVAQKR